MSDHYSLTDSDRKLDFNNTLIENGYEINRDEDTKETEKKEEEVEAQFDDSTKRKILISSLFALLIGNMMVSNVVVFLPLFVEDRNGKWSNGEAENITEAKLGYIIGSFSVAQVMFAPFCSKIKNSLGTKNTILIGFFLLVITTIGLGLIAILNDSIAFLSCAIGMRFF